MNAQPVKRVLLVDDEAFLLQGLTRVLGREGWDVAAVDSIEAALDAIGRERFDLCFLDLPGLDADGVEPLRRFRECAPQTRVVALSAHCPLPEDLRRVRELAHGFLEKPFSVEDVRRLARGDGGEEAAPAPG